MIRDAYEMCARGELSIDQMLVEVHVGPGIKSRDGTRLPELRDLLEVFSGANRACGLMLHHKELNPACGWSCAEFAWVSKAHAERAFRHAWGRRTVSDGGRHEGAGGSRGVGSACGTAALHSPLS